MPNRQCVSAVLLLGASLLSGCDTDEAIQNQQLEVLQAEEKALQDLSAFLKATPDLEGAGKVSLFLSKDLLNGVLAGADNTTVALPDAKGAFITVKSMRTDFTLGFPLVRIDAVAKKAGLDAALELSGTARIEPTIVAGTPQKLTLRIHVDSLVPRARWGILDWRIGGFVRDLMRVKLTDELRTAGTIEVPVEGDFPLALAAKQTPVSFVGAKANVATPALSLAAKAAVTRVITLPDGLHVYGKVEAKGGV